MVFMFCKHRVWEADRRPPVETSGGVGGLVVGGLGINRTQVLSNGSQEQIFEICAAAGSRETSKPVVDLAGGICCVNHRSMMLLL